MDSLESLSAEIRAFAEERDWAQFHTPKNLAMAVAGEAGELVAELQWLGDDEIAAGLDQPGELRGRLEGELADVLIYLLRLADVSGIDLAAAARRKVALNASRYPVAKARGSALKYTEFDR